MNRPHSSFVVIEDVEHPGIDVEHVSHMHRSIQSFVGNLFLDYDAHFVVAAATLHEVTYTDVHSSDLGPSLLPKS